ncbi:molybdate ABC transporter substrate-binding protein [uncultured Parvimonas sp.]|uniref:molybdate ABC transporter substrate-binding protein n=1 Tax=uncultured Parvimonas sp. TaxID=747372 RepID=UPI0025949A70|nr:molybdate ABC transporter substrate-binding protein [uncultured Parvimonas sp.]
MKGFLKKFLVLALAVGMLGACSPKQAEPKKDTKVEKKEGTEKKKITVFAAASMTETMEQIKKVYEEKHKNIELVYTFDSSGTLKKQIEQGAQADIFISAAQKQMNALDKTKTADAKVVIDEASRFNLLENKVVLAVAKGNPAKVEKFEDLANDNITKIALGNSDVPVGQYSEELLKNLNIWEKIQPKVTLGSNVKEVTTWVKEGVASCGIVYATDAYSAGLEVVATAKEGMIKTPVLYPAAVLKDSKNAKEAKEFLEFLKGNECKAIFEKVGFAIAK